VCHQREHTLKIETLGTITTSTRRLNKNLKSLFKTKWLKSSKSTFWGLILTRYSWETLSHRNSKLQIYGLNRESSNRWWSTSISMRAHRFQASLDNLQILLKIMLKNSLMSQLSTQFLTRSKMVKKEMNSKIMKSKILHIYKSTLQVVWVAFLLVWFFKVWQLQKLRPHTFLLLLQLWWLHKLFYHKKFLQVSHKLFLQKL